MKKTAAQLADEIIRKIAASTASSSSSSTSPQKGFGPTASTSEKNKWQDPARPGSRLKTPSVTNINAVTVG